MVVDQGVAGCEVLGLSKHAVLGAQEVVGRVVVEIAAETAYGVAIIFGRLWNEFVLNSHYLWIEKILKETGEFDYLDHDAFPVESQGYFKFVRRQTDESIADLVDL